MPNTREKLIDVFCSVSGGEPDYQDAEVIQFVDELIANGVTVQQWIPVSERLPEKSGLYITFGCTAVPVRWLHHFDKDVGKFGAWWDYEPDGTKHLRYRFLEAENITHWMPLPEPPKAGDPYS